MLQMPREPVIVLFPGATETGTSRLRLTQRSVNSSVLHETCKATSLPIMVMVYMLRAACADSVYLPSWRTTFAASLCSELNGCSEKTYESPALSGPEGRTIEIIRVSSKSKCRQSFLCFTWLERFWKILNEYQNELDRETKTQSLRVSSGVIHCPFKPCPFKPMHIRAETKWHLPQVLHCLFRCAAVARDGAFLWDLNAGHGSGSDSAAVRDQNLVHLSAWRLYMIRNIF